MKVKLKNVRLSFPNLFEAKAFVGPDGKPQGTPKYNATFILDKEENAAEIEQLEKAIGAIVKENFKGNMKALKGICLRDGEEKTDDEGEYKDGFGPDVMFITSSNPNRPQVVDKDPRVPLTKEDAKIYAGCYVNAVISLWAQNNTFGKRVNANVLAVQFAKDGDPFGEERINPESEFDTLEDDSDSILG